MRWMLYVGIAIVLIAAIVATVGAMLPVKHTASRTRHVPLAPDAVYKLLTGIKFGDVRVTFERQEPPSLLGSRVTGENRAFGGTWTFHVTPAGSGSDLTITEDGEVYNVIFRFMSRFVLGHYATMDAYIKNLQSLAVKR